MFIISTQRNRQEIRSNESEIKQTELECIDLGKILPRRRRAATSCTALLQSIFQYSLNNDFLIERIPAVGDIRSGFGVWFHYLKDARPLEEC